MTERDRDRRQARRWHQSIAAKLLLAFGLIAALTVGASWLSVIRFGEVETVIRRTNDVSLPLVKLSLGIEAKTGELVASAARARRVGDRAGAVPAHGAAFRADQPRSGACCGSPAVGRRRQRRRPRVCSRPLVGARTTSSARSTAARASSCSSSAGARRRSSASTAANERILALMTPVTDRIGSRLIGTIGSTRRRRMARRSAPISRCCAPPTRCAPTSTASPELLGRIAAARDVDRACRSSPPSSG